MMGASKLSSYDTQPCHAMPLGLRRSGNFDMYVAIRHQCTGPRCANAKAEILRLLMAFWEMLHFMYCTVL